MKKKLLSIASAFVIAFGLSSCSNDKEIKTVEDWKDTYPDVYATYMANAEMS